MRLIILCEDLQQEVFARQFFMSRGFRRHELDFKRSLSGKGSGEQYVRKRYVKEVISYRRKSTYIKSIALVAIIDADTYSVQQRLKQLDSALEDNGQAKRQSHEKIAIFVPKRNIETWIHYLMGKDVNEDSAYSKFSAHESRCKPLVKKLAEEICPVGLPQDAPSSLQTACKELARIL